MNSSLSALIFGFLANVLRSPCKRCMVWARLFGMVSNLSRNGNGISQLPLSFLCFPASMISRNKRSSRERLGSLTLRVVLKMLSVTRCRIGSSTLNWFGQGTSLKLLSLVSRFLSAAVDKLVRRLRTYAGWFGKSRHI